jgi:RNA polymerase subunit RPABC4/transcription elongation factor Spt4
MAAIKGKIAALVIFVLLMILAAFVLTPLALAPFGVFAGLVRGMRHAVTTGWHFGPWFPFAPAWSFSLVFFIIWIAVIVWVYRDAEDRKMSGVLWALLVLIGNLIGLLIYLIVRQDHPLPARGKTSAPVPAVSPPSPSPPASPARTPLVCPSCQKPLEKDFAFCPHCGAALRRVCRNCGKPVEQGWKICPHCGAQLEKQE